MRKHVLVTLALLSSTLVTPAASAGACYIGGVYANDTPLVSGWVLCCGGPIEEDPMAVSSCGPGDEISIHPANIVAFVKDLVPNVDMQALELP